MKRWPPDSLIKDYSGPYPLHELQQARNRLLQCLSAPYSDTLTRVLPKIGIRTCFGQGIVRPPPAYVTNSITSLVKNQSVGTAYKNAATDQVANTDEGQMQSDLSSGSVPAIRISDWTPVPNYTVLGNKDNKDNGSSCLVTLPFCTTNASCSNSQKQFGDKFEKMPSTKMVEDSDTKFTENNKERSVPSCSVPEKDDANRQTVVGSSEAAFPELLVYKCDYCRTMTRTSSEMMSHLTKSRHASGSEYIANANDETSTPLQLVAIKDMLAVRNRDKQSCAGLVIACPECRSVFDDIFTCALHDKYEHGDTGYAVCPVIHSETVSLPAAADNTCKVCSTKFATVDELFSHWTSSAEHCPVPQSTNPRVFLMQTCPVCLRTFNDDFFDCVTHIMQNHGPSVAVEVRHVMLPQRRERLPPFSSTALHHEASVLSRLQNCFEQIAINARLAEIEAALAAQHAATY